MYILQVLFAYLSYLIIFILFYFAFEKLFLWEHLIKLKNFKIIEDFVFGFSLGVITLIIQLIKNIIYQEFKAPLFVSTTILLAIFRNYKNAIFSLFPGLIFYLFNNYNNKNVYSTILFSFTSLLFIFYIKIFLSKKILPIGYLFFLITYSLIVTLVGIHNLYNHNFKMTFFNMSSIYFLSILGYYLMNYIIKLTISSKILYESSRYSFLKFFRPSIAPTKINEFLIKNKIKYGLLVLFKIDYDQKYAKLIEEVTKVNVDEYFYELLQKTVSKNGVLFNYEGNINGFFVSATTKKDQAIISKEFNYAVKILNRKYTWGINNIFFKIKTNFGVSKYGFDSQSVNNLIIYSLFALNDQPKNNKQIIYFDWKIYHSFLKDHEDINDLDLAFQLDDLKILYTPLYDLKNDCHFATYADVYNVSEFQTYETVREIAYVKNFQNTLDRYFASFVLLAAKSNSIIINYATTIFKEDFIEARFMDFFTRNNINYNSIYIIFDKRSLDKTINFSTLIKKRIKKIQDLGIKIIIPYNYSQSKIKKIIKDVKYTYIKINEIKNFKNKYKNAKTICYDITSSKQILLAYKKNIKILGGPVFDQELNFIKFSKQSKIYLENIIKGVKDG